MSALITTLHIFVCIILIMAVLLQSGKSADLAGAFGGVGSQSVFGPRGAATILHKITTISAVVFMFTSLGMWILSAKGTKSVVRSKEAATQAKPAVTEPTKKADDSTPQKETQKKTESSSPETEKNE